MKPGVPIGGPGTARGEPEGSRRARLLSGRDPNGDRGGIPPELLCSCQVDPQLSGQTLGIPRWNSLEAQETPRPTLRLAPCSRPPVRLAAMAEDLAARGSPTPAGQVSAWLCAVNPRGGSREVHRESVFRKAWITLSGHRRCERPRSRRYSWRSG